MPYAANDDKTAKRISDLLGQATESRLQRSYSGSGFFLTHRSESVHEYGRPLLTPAEVNQLPPDDGILLVGGLFAVLALAEGAPLPSSTRASRVAAVACRLPTAPREQARELLAARAPKRTGTGSWWLQRASSVRRRRRTRAQEPPRSPAARPSRSPARRAPTKTSGDTSSLRNRKRRRRKRTRTRRRLPHPTEAQGPATMKKTIRRGRARLLPRVPAELAEAPLPSVRFHQRNEETAVHRGRPAQASRAARADRTPSLPRRLEYVGAWIGPTSAAAATSSSWPRRSAIYVQLYGGLRTRRP